jgi:glutamate N-acetyltransferase/amino-acid N-acetyltransferase
MTTDTRPKTATRQLAIDGQTVTISGFCKGAGMIHPNMATMLAVITTDAKVATASHNTTSLQQLLDRAVERSFNRISVDGDTSTNDTVLLLASGASGVDLSRCDEQARARFEAALEEVCVDLAKKVARDGEGATRLVEIAVSGAASKAMAHAVANTIATSPLVKTAVHGGDPNWGRILAAAGRSGAAIDPDCITLTFGAPGAREVTVLRAGQPTGYEERQAAALFQEDPVVIRLDLGLEPSSANADVTVWTCDFSKEYVEINAHYTT